MAVFTDPEFASVGLTTEEAAERGIKIRTGVFPLQASGRAMTMDATDGMVKLIADGADRVIGAHILAPGASDMIPELTMAVAKGHDAQGCGALSSISTRACPKRSARRPSRPRTRPCTSSIPEPSLERRGSY